MNVSNFQRSWFRTWHARQTWVLELRSVITERAALTETDPKARFPFSFQVVRGRQADPSAQSQADEGLQLELS
jgi:hypothetical protein